MTQTADVIVIGAGVIGAATAFELAKQGREVLVVDRLTQAGHGSTAGSCAIIRMHYSTFDGTAFAWEGYHYWRDWADYLKAPADEALAQFREVGCLVMKTGANGQLTKHMENSAKLTCPFEEWDAARIKEALPIYQLDRYAPAKRLDDPAFGAPTGGALKGAVLWPRAGYVTDPALSAQNLLNAAKRHGAQAVLGQAVTAILTEAGRTKGVALSDGTELHAPVVINVAGPASAAINELAGVTGDMTIATRPLKQEVVHVPSPPGFDFEANGMIVSDSDIALYCRPEHGNNILVGSEDPECDTHQWVEDAVDYDQNFSDQWTTQAQRYAQRVPSLGIPSQAKGVVDLYDASTDWIPIYDKSSLPGFFMACGTSGNQYKNAPIAGKLMAALVTHEEIADHDADPLRFTLPYLGVEVNAGFYSRKREINAESSFSVLG